MTNLFGGLLFGSVGFVAFVYGKRQSQPKLMALGAVLMVFPYFLENTLALYMVGAGLTTLVFLLRE